MIFDTRKDAVYSWVETFDAIPTDMLAEWNDDAMGGCGLSMLTPCPTEGYYPMWGTMWSFHNGLDEDWARNNISTMDELGFTVYDSPHGLFFGIDGCGYDFYEDHWIPLYIARGLRWSKEDK